MLRATLLLLASMSFSSMSFSCTVDANYAGLGFACNEDEPCQAGLSCESGSCISRVIDAGPAADVDVNLPDAPDLECLPVIALSDDFSADVLAGQWTEDIANGTNLEVAAGLATFTPTTAVPTRFARIRSAAFAMTGNRFFLEIPTMVDTSSQAIAEVLLGASTNDYYFLRQSQSVLQFGTAIGGTERIIQATAYDAVAHRWWQMRMIGGLVHVDLSANGTNWVNLASTAADAISGDLYVDIGAGTRGSVGSPGQMQIDNVNTGSGLCP